MSTAQVLVVEDEAIVAFDIARQLERLGYRVVGTFASGEEAVSAAQRVRPDVVLMDVRLRGEMDGIVAAQTIREQVGIPVIYLTAYADAETLQRARITEPFGYVLKPFEVRELQTVIEMALYRHQLEDRLKDSEAQFRALAEANPALLLVLQPGNDRGRWVSRYANPAAEGITGFLRADLIERDPLDLLLPSFRAMVGRHLAAVFSGDIPARSEVAITTREGTEKWLECVVDRIVFEGKPALLFTALDVTQRRQVEQERLQMATEQERNLLFRHFVKDVAHDLKTPLTTIKMIGHLLAEVDDETRRARYLDILDEQTTHIERLLEDMLSMARLDMLPSLDLTPVNLNDLLQMILAGQEPTLRAAKLGLNVDLAPGLPLILAEIHYLSRAIGNLLTNARNYTEPGGQITVRTRYTGDQISLEVSDTGIGISSADLPHIFERFYRADQARSANAGGTGLGLAIAEKIVQMHGGTIEVESLLGQGSTFRVRFPASLGDAQTKRVPTSQKFPRANEQMQHQTA